ncbi:hypothetical protein YC2023_119201 [Brassica napus]
MKNTLYLVSAIIPMSHQFGWRALLWLVLSNHPSFGVMPLSRLPGGWLSKIFGGRKVLEVGVFTWSFATALVSLHAALIFSVPPHPALAYNMSLS